MTPTTETRPIEEATERAVCSVCGTPIYVGQQVRGGMHAHDCAERRDGYATFIERKTQLDGDPRCSTASAKPTAPTSPMLYFGSTAGCGSRCPTPRFSSLLSWRYGAAKVIALQDPRTSNPFITSFVCAYCGRRRP